MDEEMIEVPVYEERNAPPNPHRVVRNLVMKVAQMEEVNATLAAKLDETFDELASTRKTVERLKEIINEQDDEDDEEGEGVTEPESDDDKEG